MPSSTWPYPERKGNPEDAVASVTVLLPPCSTAVADGGKGSVMISSDNARTTACHPGREPVSRASPGPAQQPLTVAAPAGEFIFIVDWQMVELCPSGMEKRCHDCDRLRLSGAACRQHG